MGGCISKCWPRRDKKTKVIELSPRAATTSDDDAQPSRADGLPRPKASHVPDSEPPTMLFYKKLNKSVRQRSDNGCDADNRKRRRSNCRSRPRVVVSPMHDDGDPVVALQYIADKTSQAAKSFSTNDHSALREEQKKGKKIPDGVTVSFLSLYHFSSNFIFQRFVPPEKTL